MQAQQKQNYTCPVCHSALPYPPEWDEICLCCGTHFGYDDASTSHQELRNDWLRRRGRWSSIPEDSST
jgi:predicted amidophosphoribosyltransferase